MRVTNPSNLQRAGIAFVAAALVLTGCGHAPIAKQAASTVADAVKADAVQSGPLTLLTMPEDGVKPMLDAIHASKKSIKLKIYMLTDHDATDDIINALIERAKAGVDVAVVLEVRPFIPPDAPSCQPNPIGPNDQAIQKLLAGGVRVRYSNPRFKFTHEKTLILDDTTAYIMTCNFTNAAFTGNREYVLADKTKSDVQELLNCFQADWDATPFKPANTNYVFSPENSRAKLTNLIDSAKKSLVVQVEYMTDADIVKHVGARAQAGVDVKLMMAYLEPGTCPGDQDTNAIEAQALKAAGVTQFEFSRAIKMHAKCTIVDGKTAFIGSENYTTTSLDKNREVGYIINDPILVNKLATTAAQDWAQGRVGGSN